MRKITAEAVSAFWSRTHGMSKDNTVVMSDEAGAKMFLHGNLIASLNGSELMLSSCGWKTNTTKERLNGLLNQYCFSISQKRGKWYINGIPFNDGMVIDLDTKHIIYGGVS